MHNCTMMYYLLFLFLQLSSFSTDGFRVQSISVRSNGKEMDVRSCRYYKNDRSSSICSSSSSSSRNKGLMLKMAEESNPSSSSETKQQQQQEDRLRPVEKTDEEWKEMLSPEQYYILRKEGTESPNSSILNKISVEKNGKEDEGTFSCGGCNAALFVADAKFDSGTGWPSFFAPITSSAVDLNTDYKLIVPRTEVTCSQCGGHLGHVFEDGPEITGQRYCMNGAAMNFYRDTERPDLASKVKQMSTEDPYTIQPAQALPGALVNFVIGGIFLNAFLSGEKNTPIDFLILLPATYYGFLAVKTIGKMMV